MKPLPKTAKLAIHDRAQQGPLVHHCAMPGCAEHAMFGFGERWYCVGHRHLAEGGAVPSADARPSTSPAGPPPGADLFTPRGGR